MCKRERERERVREREEREKEREGERAEEGSDKEGVITSTLVLTNL